jgi:hypothetical protein
VRAKLIVEVDGQVLAVSFALAGRPFIGLNGGHDFQSLALASSA